MYIYIYKYIDIDILIYKLIVYTNLNYFLICRNDVLRDGFLKTNSIIADAIKTPNCIYRPPSEFGDSSNYSELECENLDIYEESANKNATRKYSKGQQDSFQCVIADSEEEDSIVISNQIYELQVSIR